MRLSELFTEGDLVVGFNPSDKWEAIRSLVEHLARAGRIPGDEVEPVVDAVSSRERSMSTGMERGIAIPHAAVDGLAKVAACMGIVSREQGLRFESVDGRPARVIVLLVIPKQQKLLHIRTLADVARVLGQEGVCDELVATKTPADAFAILTRGEVEA